MLEYYEGILFLTTNRLDQFDEAFQSRIHLTVRLPELGQNERRAIWEALLRFNRAITVEANWTPDMFEVLGMLEVNVGLRVANRGGELRYLTFRNRHG